MPRPYIGGSSASAGSASQPVRARAARARTRPNFNSAVEATTRSADDSSHLEPTAFEFGKWWFGSAEDWSHLQPTWFGRGKLCFGSEVYFSRTRASSLSRRCPELLGNIVLIQSIFFVRNGARLGPSPVEGELRESDESNQWRLRCDQSSARSVLARGSRSARRAPRCWRP